MAFVLAPRLPSILSPYVKRLCPRLNLGLNMAPTSLKKEDFTETWQLYMLKVPPKLCNHTRKALKESVLTVPRVQSVLRSKDPQQKYISLMLKYFAQSPKSKFLTPPRGNASEQFVHCGKDSVVETLRKVELKANTPADVVNFVGKIGEDDLEEKEITVGYEQWSLEDVLKNVLPEGVTVPSSFETVGHIVHLNLRDEHAEYKKLIGEVMLDKLKPRIKSVVNKLQSTGGPYRTFEMEVLAGEDNLETSVKENGCTYQLDFRKVYWNSRLETEHRKIINSLEPDDILADAFCGIGPFTIPAAKQRKCAKIYANDLNPSSVDYLRRNAKTNHVEGEKFVTSQGCARDFLRRIIKEEKTPVTRVVMNFPAGAPEFLDVFRGLYNGLHKENMPMPVVTCYCFVKSVDDMDSARQRVRTSLFQEESQTVGMELMPDSEIDVRDVRDVAPRKRQVCVTLRIPEKLAYLPCADEIRQPALKKVKT